MGELCKLEVDGDNSSTSIENHREFLHQGDRPFNFCTARRHLQLLRDRVDDLGVGIGPVHPTVPLLRLVNLAELLLQARFLVDLKDESEGEDEVKFICGSLEILDRGGEASLGKQVPLLLNIFVQIVKFFEAVEVDE